MEKHFRTKRSDYIPILKYSPNEIRGYSINKKPLPVISVNTRDSPKARNFSIFHELAHIASNTDGICNMETRDRKIERFCDSVAANFLIPSKYLLNEKLVKENNSMIWKDRELSILSKKYSVSKESMLIALIDNKKSTWDYYKNIKEEWQKAKDNNQKSDNKHIPYHNKISSWNGKYYIRILFDAYNNNLINRNNLSSYLGDVKLKHIEKICTLLRRMVQILSCKYFFIFIRQKEVEGLFKTNLYIYIYIYIYIAIEYHTMKLL